MAYADTPAYYGFYNGGSPTGSIPNSIKPAFTKAAQMQFADMCVAYGIATKNKNVEKGNSLTFAPRGMPGGGTAAITEVGDFEAPEPRDVDLGVVAIRGFQGATIALTRTQIDRAADPAKSYLQGLKTETKDATFKLQKTFNRQFYGDGTGKLCYFTSVASETYLIDTTKYPFTTRHLSKADKVFMFDATDNTIAGAANSRVTPMKIVSVDDDSHFTVDSHTTAITPETLVDWFFIAKNKDTGTTDSREIQGLAAICSTSSTYKGLAVATKPYWKANVHALSGSPDFDMSYVWMCVAECQMNGESDPDVCLVSPEMIWEVYAYMAMNIRYAPGDAGKVGFSKAEIGLPSVRSGREFTLKFMPDRYCPPGNVYMFPQSELKMLVLDDMKFLDQGAEPVMRQGRSQVFEGVLMASMEPYTERRNAFGMITGFAHNTLTANFTG
jgi:hypothetical protein